MGDTEGTITMVKRKSDFITNSSSASIIMSVYAPSCSTLEEFKERFYECIAQGDYKTKWHEPESIEQPHDGAHVFLISTHTSMYNGREDIPKYMKIMVIDNALGDLDDKFGFRDIKIKVRHDY